MLVVGKYDETGPTALRVRWSLNPRALPEAGYEAGPSALLNERFGYGSGGSTIAAPKLTKADHQGVPLFPDGIDLK